MNLFIAIFFAFVSLGFCEPVSIKLDQLSLDGQKYDKVTVVVENRFSVKIVHSSGVKRVPSTNLSEEVQKRLGLIQEYEVISPISDVSIRTIPAGSDRFNELFKIWCIEGGYCFASRIAVSQDIGKIKLCTIDLSNETVALFGDLEERADGSVFEAVVKPNGKFYDYTTVLGAPKKVKCYVIVTPPTAADFLSSIKQGMTFLIPDAPKLTRCNECSGRPVKCTKCDSTGRILIERQIRVRW